jgi:hypothetical protein
MPGGRAPKLPRGSIIAIALAFAFFGFCVAVAIWGARS